MSGIKDTLNIMAIGERVSLRVDTEQSIKAELTYSSYLSEGLVKKIDDEAILKEVVCKQVKPGVVTLEKLEIYDTSEDAAKLVLEGLESHLKEKGYKCLLTFTNKKDLTAYTTDYGFEKVLFIYELNKWLLAKDLTQEPESEFKIRLEGASPYKLNVFNNDVEIGYLNHAPLLPNGLVEKLDTKTEHPIVTEYQGLDYLHLKEIKIEGGFDNMVLLKSVLDELESYMSTTMSATKITLCCISTMKKFYEQLGFEEVINLPKLNSVFMVKKSEK